MINACEKRNEQKNIDVPIKHGCKKAVELAVLGSGYVGLPTAALFADAGFHVTAVDINNVIVEKVNRGISPIDEPGLNQLIWTNVQSNRLSAELFSKVNLQNKDMFIITVQTPIDEDKKPNLSFMFNALASIGKSLRKGAIIAVCSTIPPGTLHEKVKPFLESLSGLRADFDFYLAYVPERIAPGNALKEFINGPRLVGGIGSESTQVIADIFRKICKNIVETDATTAEISKTAENTFRDVNIAFANQLALICEQHGADIVAVTELANTHPRVKIHTSGPGVGGPCLTKDPYLLIDETVFESQNIVEIARKINDYMPHHVVELVQEGLACAGKKIKNSVIALLGTSYKANVDDPRLSPSEPIIKELVGLRAEVRVFDPHCRATFGAKKTISLSDVTMGSDCLVIVIDHTEFKNLDLYLLKKWMNANPIIVDGKRIINPANARKIGFEYYGIGYGSRNRVKQIENAQLFPTFQLLPHVSTACIQDSNLQCAKRSSKKE